MPRRPSPARPASLSGHERRRLAAALRAARSPADDAFDRFLSPELREVSGQYWTPLRAVRQAAAWLREAEVRTVVDIGSRAGKFCVAAVLLARCHFIGLEKRAPLVGAARELAEMFDVDDRVTFVHGDLSDVTALAGDAYYFFNPFGEYAFYSTFPSMNRSSTRPRSGSCRPASQWPCRSVKAVPRRCRAASADVSLA